VSQAPYATNHRSGELLTVRETADVLKLKPWTVYRLVKSGEIPAVKVGGSIRINRDEMFDALARHPVRVEEDTP
jgi:excisionase family DNA binding protein